MALTWDEYESWETDKDEFQKIQERYQQAKDKLDVMVTFEEKFQNAYQLLDQDNDIEPMKDLLGK
jgi:hypothetical protein